MKKMMKKDSVIIKYSGDEVCFGQCYDGLTGIISGYFGDRYRITLDAKLKRKINDLNYRTGSDWTIQPSIPFQYV